MEIINVETTERVVQINATTQAREVAITVNPAVVGIKGEKGDQGSQGERGEKGEIGTQGIQGEKGERGDKGTQGDRGEKGEKGDSGIQGVQGERGLQGVQGSKGDKGDVGAKGDKGDKGDVGLQGIQGDKGEKGIQGDKGDKGEKGEAGANGWSPLLVMDSTTIAGKSLLKLTDWTGGTGTKPTTNVGQWLKGDGTYTDVASEANDLKGASGDNLIASYTHSGNKEVVIQSYDSGTGIFTAPNHGLTNGRGGNFLLNWNINENPTNIMFAPLGGYGYNIVVIDVNTFKLSVNPTVPSSLDFTKFHFEEWSNLLPINFTNINSKNIRFKILTKGFRRADSGLGIYAINGVSPYTGLSNISTNFGNKTATLDATSFLIHSVIDVFSGKKTVINFKTLRTVATNNSTVTSFLEEQCIVSNLETTQITSITSMNFMPNGAQIDIYKL